METKHTDDRFRFMEYEIPSYMRDGLINYIEHKIPPGGFLSAVICNDLVGAVSRADNTNIRNIPAYANFLYNHAPSRCWGSEEIMENWLKQ